MSATPSWRYFGRLFRSADHAIEAVTAALDCQAQLKPINREHASPIQHRIGLNTGEALIKQHRLTSLYGFWRQRRISPRVSNR